MISDEEEDVYIIPVPSWSFNCSDFCPPIKESPFANGETEFCQFVTSWNSCFSDCDDEMREWESACDFCLSSEFDNACEILFSHDSHDGNHEDGGMDCINDCPGVEVITQCEAFGGEDQSDACIATACGEMANWGSNDCINDCPSCEVPLPLIINACAACNQAGNCSQQVLDAAFEDEEAVEKSTS